MLRATFRVDGNEIVQEILPLNTRVCEVKEYVTDDLRNTILDIFYRSDSLDINDKLIKIGLVKNNEQSYVVLVMHHLIIDGISWSILIDDLTQIYINLIKNKENNLLRPYPYKDWIKDVKCLAENISDDERQHWIEIDGMLDDSLIQGTSKVFVFKIDQCFDVENSLLLSEEVSDDAMASDVSDCEEAVCEEADEPVLLPEQAANEHIIKVAIRIANVFFIIKPPIIF